MASSRRGVRLAVALAVVLPGPLLPLAAKAADSTTVKASTAVWFWRDQQVVEGQVVPPTDPSAVPGDEEVSGPDDQSGVPDKSAWFQFGDFAYPPGSSVSSCSLSIAVDTANSPLNTANPAALVAMLATSGFAGKDGPQLGAAVPSTSTTTPVAGVFDATANTYTFTIPSFCQSWVDAENIGVGIRTAPGATSPAPVQLLAASAALVSSLDVPTTAQLIAPVTPAPSPSPAAAAAKAAATSKPSAKSSPAPAVVVPPAAPAQVALPPALLPTTDAAPSVAAPTVAAAAPTTAPEAAPVAQRVADVRGVHSALPAGFWVTALLLLALAFGFAWLLRSAPVPPSSYRPRRSVLSSHANRR